MYRYLDFGHPAPSGGGNPCVLEQLRERVRLLHCSPQTEASHLRWAGAFLRWQQDQTPAADQASPQRPLRPDQAHAYLASLAQQPRLTATEHRQALQALLFLYRHVGGLDLLVFQ